MKLSAISETFIGTKIRDAMASSNFFNRPAIQSDQPYEASTGHDNQPENQSVVQATGVPTKPRHRRYFGMERRTGVIRL